MGAHSPKTLGSVDIMTSSWSDFQLARAARLNGVCISQVTMPLRESRSELRPARRTDGYDKWSRTLDVGKPWGSTIEGAGWHGAEIAYRPMAGAAQHEAKAGGNVAVASAGAARDVGSARKTRLQVNSWNLSVQVSQLACSFLGRRQRHRSNLPLAAGASATR